MFDNIIAFTELAEVRNFSKASQRIKISQSNLSKRISDLESFLGVMLILRSTRSFELTGPGEIMYQKYKHLRSELITQKALFNNLPTKMIINICVTPMIADLFLPLIIHDFVNNRPDIAINTICQNTPPNLDDCGLAITYQNLDLDERFEKVILRTEKLKLFCAAAYRDKFGIPESIEDIRSHKIVGILDNSKLKPMKSMIFTNRFTSHQYTYDLNQLNLQMSMSQELKKVGMLGEYIFGYCESMCRAELASGEIVPVLPEYEFSEMNTFLIYRKNNSFQLQALVDFIQECSLRI